MAKYLAKFVWVLYNLFINKDKYLCKECYDYELKNVLKRMEKIYDIQK